MRLLFIAFLMMLISSCEQHEEKVVYTSGEFSQEVYVWQRVWTDEVKEAVSTKAIEFDNTILLAAEIEFDKNAGSDAWSCQHFFDPISWALKNSGEYGLAIRINSKAAASGWTEIDCLHVISYISPYVKSAKMLQIDYDCPSKKLADYTKFLKQLKKELPDTPIEITCLPDWLNFPEFAELVQQVDRYVMQVHGVSGHGKGRALCNADDAYRVAIDCAEYNVSYLIALPTYRHAVSYAEDGKIAQVASEGSYQKSTYELATADPVELSALIERWEDSRPALMDGVIWYRLPVVTDRMNWTWETLAKVKQGDFKKHAEPTLKVEKDSNGLYRLILSNNSDQHIDWPKKISLNWEGKTFCIAQQSKNYLTEKIERSKGATLLWSGSTPYPLAPGESLSCGWFRFSEAIEPEQIIITNTP